MKDETVLVAAGRDPKANFGVVNPPVYRASTILYDSLEAYEAPRKPQGVHYGRSGVPTTFALENALAAIEGADCALVTGSGKTAIVQSMLAVLKAGDHVLMVDSTYQPTRVFCDRVLARFGVETTYYDPVIGAGIEALIRPETRIVYCESPGSLTFEVQDIPAIAEVAHTHGALVFLDNTWATPLFFKPFAHGVDVSIQAATKYVGGHSDLMMGTVTCKEAQARLMRQGMQDVGAYASPDDCYQALKGLRTLAVRLGRHQTAALELAHWLNDRPEVSRVLHPAFPNCPGHAFWKRDFSGSTGLFSVVLQPCSREALAAFIDHLEYFGLGASWGGYESLVLPGRPERLRTATTWDEPGPLLRFHIGLEDPQDLIVDLEEGFARMKATD